MTRSLCTSERQTWVSLLLGRAMVREREPESAAQIRRHNANVLPNSSSINDAPESGRELTKAERDALAIDRTLLHDIKQAWHARKRRNGLSLDQLRMAVADGDDRFAAMLLASGVRLPTDDANDRKQMLRAILLNREMCRTANVLVELEMLNADTDFDLDFLVECSNTPHTTVVRLICENRSIQAQLAEASAGRVIFRQLTLRYAYWRAANFVNFHADIVHLKEVLQHVDISGLDDRDLGLILFDGNRFCEMPQRSSLAIVRQLAAEIAGSPVAGSTAVSRVYEFSRHFADLVELFSPRRGALDEAACRVFYLLFSARIRSERLNLTARQIEDIESRMRIPLSEPSLFGVITADDNGCAAACA